MAVVVGEQAVAVALVEQLDGAHAAVLHAHRCTQDGAGLEAGVVVHRAGEVRVQPHIAHHLADVVVDAAADDALRGADAQPRDVHRPVAGAAHQRAVVVLEQEQGGRLRAQVVGDARQRLAQRLGDVQRGREILADAGEELEVLAEIRAGDGAGRGFGGDWRHRRNMHASGRQGKHWPGPGTGASRCHLGGCVRHSAPGLEEEQEER